VLNPRPRVSPKSEIKVELFSKDSIVIQGVQNSGSKNSRSSTHIQNQSPPTSLRRENTKTKIEGIDNTLILPEFKGVGSEDPEQHLFVCKVVWATKNIQDDVLKIV